ncbi:MAG: hypothetical protein K9W44_08020 [Candidatus Lokiarchaeota archaeon]|nr:hypothetical protein [Candidatus Harpocratesius repetitus]
MHQKYQVEKAFVFDQYGLAKVMFDFNQNQLVLDEILLSGFLSAIDGFSQNIFQNKSSHFVIDTGSQKISLFKSEGLIIAIISDQDLILYKDQILSLLSYFASNYPIDSNSRQDPELYEDFKIKLIYILFQKPISVDWIPVLDINDQNISEWKHLQQKFPILTEVDGKTEIQNLPGFSRDQEQTILEVFNYCSYQQMLHFDMMIEERDYVCGSEKLIDLLNGKSNEYKILKNKYQSFEFIDLLSDLKSHQAVFRLQSKYGKDILDVLNGLEQSGYIILIPDNQRKILLLVDLVEEFLQILQSIVKPKKFSVDLRFLLDKLDFPEITSRIQIDSRPIWIKKDDILSQYSTPNEMAHFMDIWITFERTLVDFYYSKYKRQLNTIIHEKLINHYLNIIHPQDLNILNPFLTAIEGACLD